VRLKAEPLRTDMNLSDTGLLRMDGTWQRAGSLRETPLQFSLEWDRVQLGQLTKLISGNDKGWRGEVRLEATLSGMPASMRVAGDASIRNFHRYDISSSEGLGLTAHCDGRYSSADEAMHEILCTGPVGDGMITLRGEAGLPGIHKVDLTLNAEEVPVGAVAQLARRAKKGIPADLVSGGSVQGRFAVKEDGPSARGAEFQGQGEITNLRLQSANAKVDFAPGNIPFTLNSGRGTYAPSKGKSLQRVEAQVSPRPDELHIEYGPFPVALGRPIAAQARGWLARSGYGISLRGDGEVSRALRLASLLGLPAVKANVEGVAQMDLQIAGSWAGNVSGSTGFSSPEVTGTVQLHNVHATVRGTNGPIEISSANLKLLPDEVRVERLSARAADAQWTGSVTLPRGCGTPGACLVRFNLSSEEVGMDELHEWLSSQPSERPWYRMLSSSEPKAPTFLESLRATGEVNAGRLRIRNLVTNRVSAAVDVDRGKLKISELRADVLGGKHRGDWRADFTGGPPVYAGSGTLTGISLGLMSEAMDDPWISGTASGAYQVTASGADSAAFWQSAEGAVQFDLRDGVLPHISLASEEGPLRVARWQGRARLRSGKIEIEKGKLVSPVEAYEVSGAATFGRVLDLRLTRDVEVKPVGAGSLVYSITGTVAEPRVALTPAPETQARLKP
jgi:AsmA-like C-terminal region